MIIFGWQMRLARSGVVVNRLCGGEAVALA